MIDVGNCYFACDECPISENVEYRLQVAREGGYPPQFEYCGCDKVQTEFLVSGCCEDAYVNKPSKKKKGKRKTGTEYRRAMEIKHRDDLMWVIDSWRLSLSEKLKMLLWSIQVVRVFAVTGLIIILTTRAARTTARFMIS